jgi:hypothetical protein
MSDTDFLYELLPTIYRQTDIPGGKPLRALFTILQEQHDLLKSDIATLYDNWFVETCEPWALPYLANLLGADRIRDGEGGIDTRRLVANTLAYRRRKGVVATIEHVAEDATGWPARVVEGADLVAMMETGRRSRARPRGTISTRDIASLDLLGGPFDVSPRTAQLRVDGLSNLDRVGIFLWRLQSYPLRSIEAAAVGGAAGRFTFHPLGHDMRLFNRRLGSYGIDRRNGMRNVPAPLSRHLLADELGRPSTVRPTDSCFLRWAAPAFTVYLVDPAKSAIPETVPCSDLAIGDLSHWRQPIGKMDARVIVDPERGRLMLLREHDRRRKIRVLTDHCYGLAGDVGAGPGFQPATPFAAGTPTWRARLEGAQVHIDDPSGATDHTASLDAVLAAWAASHQDGTIEIADSGTYRIERGDGDQALPNILLAESGRSLTIQAAPHQRPCINGTFVIHATAAKTAVTLDGLLIGGGIHTRGAMQLTLRHCTVIPARGNIGVVADPDASDGLRVALQSTMTAALRLPTNARELRITDSIVDGGDLRAIAAPERGAGKDDRGTDDRDQDGGDLAALRFAGPAVIVARTTFIGDVVVAEIQASDSIFTAQLAVSHQHRGFVRYCSIAAGSRTPRRYACQPDADHAGLSGGAGDPIAGSRIRPRFTSLTFGHPGYAQLAAACPREILAGASNGAEMGAFNIIDDIRRRDNLRDMLDEHLPIGYRPVTIYVT